MKRSIKASKVLAVVLGMLGVLAVAGVAHATKPVEGGGTFTPVSFVPTDSRTAGGNVFIEGTETGMLLGSLAGDYVFEQRITVHRNGKMTFNGWVTCTCTAEVDGDMWAGVVTLRIVGTGEADALGEPESFSGHFTIVDSAGAPGELRGQGTFEGTGTGGTYTSYLHLH